MATKLVGTPNVRDDPPVTDDYGMVTRPILDGVVVDVEQVPSTASTIVSVPASLVAVPILAANASRHGFSVRNNSTTGTLYLKCSAAGGAVSSAFHTVALVPGAYYEDPYHYVGEVTGIWSIASGEALVTEYS